MAKEKDFIFKEVSAKDGNNINELFYVEIFDKISKKYGLAEPEEDKNNRMNTDPNKKNAFKIGDKDTTIKPKKKKKCC